MIFINSFSYWWPYIFCSATGALLKREQGNNSNKSFLVRIPV